MRVIAKGKEQILLLWGNARPAETRYRLIRYLVQEQCGEGTLLLNIVSGELILLSEKENELLSLLPSPYVPEMDELIAHRFLVTETFDESKSVDQLRTLLKKLQPQKGITGFSILPTTACNARCFYCFESNEPRYTMTAEIAEKTVEFIAAHCEPDKTVPIKWFGGEPTAGEKRIDQICDLLQEKGIRYTSSMISNAYLFDEEMVRKAKEKWKLTSIQITLDGTEPVYNQVKAYVNAEGSPYQRVMRNIGLLLDAGIRVLVRINLDKHNEDDLTELVKELGNRFSGRKLFEAYAAPLFEGAGYAPIIHQEDDHSGIVQSVLRLNQQIEQVGCRRGTRYVQNSALPSLRYYYCMADNPRSIQINPLGQFGKCEHYISTHLVGSLKDGCASDSPEWQYWMNPVYLESCKKCSLYPDCGLIKNCETAVPCLSGQVMERTDDIKKQIWFAYRNRSQEQTGGDKVVYEETGV